MTPDVNLKSYYLQYISNAKADIIKYNEAIAQTIEIKEKLYEYLDKHIVDIKIHYNINLADYDKEWNHKEYDNEVLYNKVITTLNVVSSTDVNRIKLIQLIKYCNALRSEYKNRQLITICDTRKNITFGKYRTYVVNYYNQVHKVVLEGDGYKFGHGIGTYCINHWKIDLDKHNKVKRLDFAATNAKKKELIAKGVKLYDDKEATWYAARNIPYDGVHYRVFKNESSFYDFTFVKSSIFPAKTLEYKRTEYIATKYRGLSYKDMYDALCTSIKDVYTLQVDIKYKLNILLHKDPNIYLNFIRNAEQHKYKRGAHNS